MRKSSKSLRSCATGSNGEESTLRLPTTADIVASLSARMAGSARERLRPREWHGLIGLMAELPGDSGALFTTRWRAASDGGLLPLNLRSPAGGVSSGQAHAVASGDDRHLMAGLGSPGMVLVSPHQVHGTAVVGASQLHAGEVSDADAVVLNPVFDAGLAAVLRFADCVPVALVSESDLGLVHAGWRGLLAGVVGQAARAMTARPGLAFVGPSIGPCCYTVGDDVVEAFASRFGPDVVLPGNRVDLWLAADRALHEVGVSMVVNPRLCTRCNSDLFYSHRAEGAGTGRQGLLGWASAQAVSGSGQGICR